MKSAVRSERVSPGARRWLAHPVLSALLMAVWLLLQQSVALPHLLVGGVIGVIVPWLVHGFLAPGVRPRAWGRAAWLFAVVLWDIVVSNVVVARLVLSPRRKPQPCWVRVPLEVQEPLSISLLAAIITMTPGTVSCVVDEQRREIVVHALDCADADEAALHIKQRYERPLKEILG